MTKEEDMLHLFLVTECQKIRQSLMEIERMLRVMHAARHPQPKHYGPLGEELAGDLVSAAQRLSPEDRADIDDTP